MLAPSVWCEMVWWSVVTPTQVCWMGLNERDHCTEAMRVRSQASAATAIRFCTSRMAGKLALSVRAVPENMALEMSGARQPAPAAPGVKGWFRRFSMLEMLSRCWSSFWRSSPSIEADSDLRSPITASMTLLRRRRSLSRLPALGSTGGLL